MIQIAIYGKGGIGKSTVAANLSAALAESGKRVLQIGCDPKHDSTRLLLGGRISTTVLDYVRGKPPDQCRLGDLMFEGYGGVSCVETGGPEPGVGCAGRGILSTFELLKRLGIQETPFDIVLYDVLGDVVCGGFAVPLRREYADVVFLITSGEFMALYAANNILRGIQNFNGSSPRVGGIIHNGRGLELEDMRVEAFARAVQIPIIASIPRSELFAQAERQGRPIMELYPGSKPAGIFRDLVRYTEGLCKGSVPLFPALPLDDDEIEEIVLGRKLEGKTERPRISAIPCSESDIGAVHLAPEEGEFITRAVRNGEPLMGCALAGAVSITSQIEGAFTIVHGPRSCAHIVSNFLSSTRRSAHNGTVHPVKRSLAATDMGEESFIFGGQGDLERVLQKGVEVGWKVFFVATTCPAGLIGDDVELVASRAERSYPGIRVIYVPTDGNVAGDFSQGLVEGYKKGADLIDPSVDPEEGWVNIVGEKILASNVESNFRTMEDLLSRLGLRVNCRFLRNTDIAAVRSFQKAGMNILACDDDSNRILENYLHGRFGCSFFDLPFPTGFRETVCWLETLSDHIGMEKEVRSMVEEERQLHEREMTVLRQRLEGRSVLINTYDRDLDWVFDTVSDLGMKPIKVGSLSPTGDEILKGRYGGAFPVELNYSAEDRARDLKEYRPDLVLSNVLQTDLWGGTHQDTLPLCPDVGFHSGLTLARRWSVLLRLPAVEGWRLDGRALG